MASISDAGLSEGSMRAEYSMFMKEALRYSIYEAAIVISIIVLSVVKPWGRRAVKNQVNRKVLIISLSTVLFIVTGYSVFTTVQLNKIRNMPVGNVESASTVSSPNDLQPRQSEPATLPVPCRVCGQHHSCSVYLFLPSAFDR